MATCSVRWRSSGGRGEFEFVPAESLMDRQIDVFFEPLGITIPAEVYGTKAQGKPRLRKNDSNNRQKFHLPQLVMAVTRMPEPAREDTSHTVSFPLENKAFVMDAMDFDIIDDDGLRVTIAPLRVSVLHSTFIINLQDRLVALKQDIDNQTAISGKHPALGAAIKAHSDAVFKDVNDADIRKLADIVIGLQAKTFGKTNVASITKLDEIIDLPPAEIESDITGLEGKLLTRVHSFKERDKKFSKKVKEFYKKKNGGKLICEACGLDPISIYGPDGDSCIEAHHKIPIEELQPDSVTRIDDMAMVCASCHRIIHTKKPCLLIDDVVI